jgi:D-tyrosyl-tRNA(Tyr) deacylase
MGDRSKVEKGIISSIVAWIPPPTVVIRSRRMRVVVQRVKKAQVTVDAEVAGRIGPGLLVLLGVGVGDGPDDALSMAERVANLRIFADEKGQMNRSALDVGGEVLVVSQFTLLGDARRGRRPSYKGAAPPEEANRLYERFVDEARRLGLRVETGVFRAMMDVALVNEGPVTILLDSRKAF